MRLADGPLNSSSHDLTDSIEGLHVRLTEMFVPVLPVMCMIVNHFLWGTKVSSERVR